MDMNKNLLIKLLLKKLKTFSENYESNKPPENTKYLNFNGYKKYSPGKIVLYKGHKIKFTSNLKKVKKLKLNCSNINSQKYNHLHHHNLNNILSNNFHGKSIFHKKNLNKSQDKQFKINLISQKFKIADDFNEKNSNQFLYEKDEYLREVILTDEFEEDDSIHFYLENEKENIDNLLIIKKNRIFDNNNSKRTKKSTIVDDRESLSLMKLNKGIK